MTIKPSTHQKLWLFFALLISTLSATAQAPTASFTVSDADGCAPHVVTFNATGSTGSNLSYNWNLGNTPPVTVPTSNATPQTVYSNPGTYTVTLSVTNSNGTSATVSKTITVFPNPTANFTANPAAGCPPLTTNFAFTGTTGGAGTMNYVWSVANGPLLSGPNPSTIYTTSGCRNVTLTVTNTTTGCAAALTKNSLVCVHEKPTVNFTAFPTVFCDPPAQVSFNATATGGTPGYTYNWNFGSTNQSPTHTYNGPAPAMYSPSVTVTDANGCSSTETKVNHVQIKKLQAAMSGPASACAGQPVSFVNTSTPVFTGTQWDFGAGITLNGTYVFHNPGTYPIMMIAEDGPCRDTAYKNILIHARPTVDFTFNPAQPCPAPVTINFTGTGATTYAWSFGGPTTANTSNTYPIDGQYTVSVVGTNANGCKDTTEKSFEIHPWEMTLDSDPALGGCAPLTVNFSVDNNYFYPITNYTWSIGGSSGTNPNKQLVFNTPGIYTITVTATASNGCTKTASKTIKVGSKANPSFYASPTTACASETVIFTNTTLPPFDEATFFFGDGKSGVGNPHASNNYDTSGVFTVKLVVKYNECLDTVIRTNYITIKDPVAKASNRISCTNPKQVEFTNRSTNYTSFVWHFGDGNTSTAMNPTHTYASLGTYTPRIVAHNSTTGCYDSFFMYIVLIDPQPQLTGADLTLCQGDKTQFTGGFSNPALSPKDYWWYVNGALQTIDSNTTYTHTFPTTGYYTIQLVTTDAHDCLDTITRTNYVLVSKPNPSFTSTLPKGCSPIFVTFTDNSTYTTGTGYTSRAWDFAANGASTIPGASPITRTFTKGAYDIKLVVTDSHGCKDSVTKPSYVEAWKPTAAFDASDSNSCIGTVLTFNDKSTNGGTANWWFGDGGQGTGSPVTHAYNSTGQYTVRMVSIDAHNCKDTMTLQNIINIAKPTASFTITPKTFAICPPLTVAMNNQSTGAGTNTYAWDLGDGNTDTNPNTNNTYTNPGQFNVRLIAISDQGCRDTAYQTVNILGYAGSLDYTPLKGCNPLTVNFTTNLTNVPSIVWDFNDGSILAANNGNPVSHTYTVPGSYIPKLLLSDGAGCSSTSEGLKTIEVDDVWAGFKFSPACVGSIVTFEDTSKSFFSPLTQRQWQFHDGSTSTNTTPSVYYPTAGIFPIMLSAENANGCKDTLHTQITIHELPIISAGPDTTICLSDAAQLIGSGGISYKWSPPNELTCVDCATPMASPKTTFTYTVIGTDANRCSDTDAVTVYLKTKTDSEVDPGGEICDGEAFLLKAYGATSYVWTPASSLNESNIAEPTAKPNKTTRYMVLAREGSCIPDTGFVDVTVFPRPTINASGSTTIIAGGEAQLQSSGERIDRFQWSHSSTLNCDDCPSPMAKPTRTTNYTVTAYTDHGCQDSSHVTITVLCDNSQLFIPNTFTPNGDGQNDKFFPRGVGIDQVTIFRIFNRWGEVVYERNGIMLNDENTGWDGTFRGQQLSPDVFVYIVEAKCDNGDILKWKGDISLVR